MNLIILGKSSSTTNFDHTIQLLKEKQAVFLSEPMQTEYGFMTIIKDPDERKIELYKK